MSTKNQTDGQIQYQTIDLKAEIWTATPELRWKWMRAIPEGPSVPYILQQKWISNDGAIEWRDVPVEH